MKLRRVARNPDPRVWAAGRMHDKLAACRESPLDPVKCFATLIADNEDFRVAMRFGRRRGGVALDKCIRRNQPEPGR